MGKKAKKFELNDFVFAKVKGYPSWPAKVKKKNEKYKLFHHNYLIIVLF